MWGETVGCLQPNKQANVKFKNLTRQVVRVKPQSRVGKGSGTSARSVSALAS